MSEVESEIADLEKAVERLRSETIGACSILYSVLPEETQDAEDAAELAMRDYEQALIKLTLLRHGIRTGSTDTGTDTPR